MTTKNSYLKRYDFAIFLIMVILAGCGLIYEYLLSHYAGRVLGALETVIFSMIGIMVVSMGLGAFLARYIKCPFTAFAWLEILIAALGSSSILVMGFIFASVHTLPQIIGNTFGMPPDLFPHGGYIASLLQFAEIMPYICGFLLGTMIGIEIPLIAQVREALYGKKVEHNTGDIYGMDYIGAGIGALLWVAFMLAMDSCISAALVATANVAIGLLFYFLFYQRIKWRELLLMSHILVGCIIITVGMYGPEWSAIMEDTLYKDKIAHRINTKYQRVVITERIMDPAKPKVLALYINGRTQFSSNDEHIYHAMLTYPPMAASARHDSVLIIGGGDGLALRDVLRWQPKEVLLIDLDDAIVDFFKNPRDDDSEDINARLLALNKRSFSDPRVNFMFGDAYKEIDKLLQQGKMFDTIILDLPDPNHPDLNKLYSARFYTKLHQLLAGDGAISIQSTSPYHAKDAFLSIGVTMRHAGFKHVEQYHHNVPSFGEWGWTIATKIGRTPKQRLALIDTLPIDDGWTTKGNLMGAFEFGKKFFANIDQIKINRLGSGVAYQYYRQNWEIEQGIYQLEKPVSETSEVEENIGSLATYRSQ